jgi:hypothetical protein
MFERTSLLVLKRDSKQTYFFPQSAARNGKSAAAVLWKTFCLTRIKYIHLSLCRFQRTGRRGRFEKILARTSSCLRGKNDAEKRQVFVLPSWQKKSRVGITSRLQSRRELQEALPVHTRGKNSRLVFVRSSSGFP